MWVGNLDRGSHTQDGSCNSENKRWCSSWLNRLPLVVLPTAQHVTMMMRMHLNNLKAAQRRVQPEWSHHHTTTELCGIVQSMLHAFLFSDTRATGANNISAKWLQQAKRFENFIVACVITNNSRKTAQLLHYVREEVYNIHCVLPEPPATAAASVISSTGNSGNATLFTLQHTRSSTTTSCDS